MTDPLPLPVQRLLLTVRAEESLMLPAFAGSMLRGALGHALLRQSPLPHDGNQSCALGETCTYCQVFHPLPTREYALQKFSNLPAPYCIEPPVDAAQPAPQPLASGQEFTFGIVLIGRAVQHRNDLLAAFASACQHGLDVRAGRASRCTLIRVHLEGSDAALWQHGQPLPNANALCPSPAFSAPETAGKHYTLQFRTPLRLQIDGRPVRSAHQLTARALLIALARRTQLLMDTQLAEHAPQQDFDALGKAAESVQIDARALRWYDQQRYSSRQQRNTPLGGLLGTVHLTSEAQHLRPFVPLLHLGQWLHVGKNATMGMGAYTLEEPS